MKWNKTELLDRLARDGDSRLLLARTLDKLESAQRRSIPTHTNFLSPSERADVESLLAACGHPAHLFFGGFDGAERTVCYFLPDWQEEEDALGLERQGEGILRALRCTYPADSGLTHRDFLGSILGQGITRETIGDLIVCPDHCDILLLQEVEDFLLLHLESAGRTKLKIKPLPLEEVEPPVVTVKTIRDTVSSPRLDAVAAAGFTTSRGKAADLISSGRVQLNHRECTKPDRLVSEGDVISCRGLGKCRVKSLSGQTKKGRIPVELERYI